MKKQGTIIHQGQTYLGIMQELTGEEAMDNLETILTSDYIICELADGSLLGLGKDAIRNATFIIKDF